MIVSNYLVNGIFSGLLLLSAFRFKRARWLIWLAFIPTFQHLTIGNFPWIPCFIAISIWVFSITTFYRKSLPITLAILFSFAIITIYLLTIWLGITVWQSSGIPYFITIPSLWVSMDYLRMKTPYLRQIWVPTISNLIASDLPIAQISNITGANGLTFLVIYFNLTLSWAIAGFGITPAFMAIFITILIYLWGLWRARMVNVPSWISIALIQDNLSKNKINRIETDPTRLGALLLLSEQTLEKKPEFIVWPEICLKEFNIRDDVLLNILKSFSKETKTNLVINFLESSPTGEIYNSVAIVEKNGELSGFNKKRNMLFGEVSHKPSAREPFYTSKFGELILGTVLGYDTHFDDIIRTLANRGAKLILIPTNLIGYGNNFLYYIHLSDTILRAIENQVAIAIVGADGPTALIDPFGHIRAISHRYKQQDIIVDGLFVWKGKTPFTIFGNWFALLCVAFSIFLIFFV